MLEITGVYHDVNPSWSVGKGSGINTFVYVTDGTVVYWVGDRCIHLEKGEAFYIPHSVERSWSSHPEQPHDKYTVMFTCPDDALEALPLLNQASGIFRCRPRNAAYFEQRFAFLFVQWLGRRSYYGHLSGYVLAELLTMVAQDKAERRASPMKERTVRKLQEHILYHFRENILIEDLAEIAEVSPNYVTVLFKEVMGVTPIQYLHHLRINTAVNLFEHTQMTVKEVAEYLGYCDQSYFNRMFKKWMGAAPTRLK